MAKNKAAKGSFIVRMRCVVTKDVCVSHCTEEQAREDPWEFAQDENEVDQEDWTVLSVESIE